MEKEIRSETDDETETSGRVRLEKLIREKGNGRVGGILSPSAAFEIHWTITDGMPLTWGDSPV